MLKLVVRVVGADIDHAVVFVIDGGHQEVATSDGFFQDRLGIWIGVDIDDGGIPVGNESLMVAVIGPLVIRNCFLPTNRNKRPPDFD
jgi:hypothetical protein